MGGWVGGCVGLGGWVGGWVIQDIHYLDHVRPPVHGRGVQDADLFPLVGVHGGLGGCGCGWVGG